MEPSFIEEIKAIFYLNPARRETGQSLGDCIKCWGPLSSRGPQGRHKRILFDGPHVRDARIPSRYLVVESSKNLHFNVCRLCWRRWRYRRWRHHRRRRRRRKDDASADVPMPMSVQFRFLPSVGIRKTHFDSCHSISHSSVGQISWRSPTCKLSILCWILQANKKPFFAHTILTYPR